jgi:hypothetical protein
MSRVDSRPQGFSQPLGTNHNPRSPRGCMECTRAGSCRQCRRRDLYKTVRQRSCANRNRARSRAAAQLHSFETHRRHRRVPAAGESPGKHCSHSDCRFHLHRTRTKSNHDLPWALQWCQLDKRRTGSCYCLCKFQRGIRQLADMQRIRQAVLAHCPARSTRLGSLSIRNHLLCWYKP